MTRYFAAAIAMHLGEGGMSKGDGMSVGWCVSGIGMSGGVAYPWGGFHFGSYLVDGQHGVASMGLGKPKVLLRVKPLELQLRAFWLVAKIHTFSEEQTRSTGAHESVLRRLSDSAAYSSLWDCTHHAEE